MSQKLILKENQTTYIVAIEEHDLADQPVILKQDDREIAAIIPIDRYRAFESWEKQQSQPLPHYPEFEQEQAAFKRLEPSLMATYKDRYVAIRGGQVVDSDEDKMTLISRVYNTLGYGPMYVHKVGEPVRVVKLRSPRKVK
jgi:hypothetical protein